MNIHFLQALVITLTFLGFLTPADMDLKPHIHKCCHSDDISPSRSKTKNRWINKSIEKKDNIQDLEDYYDSELNDFQGRYVPYFFPLK